MKLKVEKKPRTKRIRVELTCDPGQPPVVVELDEDKAALLVTLLTQAARQDQFVFVLEV